MNKNNQEQSIICGHCGSSMKNDGRTYLCEFGINRKCKYNKISCLIFREVKRRGSSGKFVLKEKKLYIQRNLFD